MPPTNNQELPQPVQRQDGYSQPPASGAMPPGYSPAAPQQPAPEYTSASQQKKLKGKLWFILFIVMTVLFLSTAGFATWAFMERNDYKFNTEAIVDEEVASAVEANTEQLEAEFLEREKRPFESYTSPSATGSVRIEYPKTWSAFVEESSSGNTPVEGYFHPGFVPEPSDNMIALSIEIVNTDYERALRSYESLARRSGTSIEPIDAENVPGVVGSRVNGEIERGVQGSAVLFQIRDKTLILTTQSTEFMDDFDNIILANLDFTP